MKRFIGLVREEKEEKEKKLNEFGKVMSLAKKGTMRIVGEGGHNGGGQIPIERARERE